MVIERRGLRPFLKWVGGKRQLLPVLRRYYPEFNGRYFEPFVGSGAVFFDLFRNGRLAGRPVTLSDGNPDLIGCYRRIADSLDAVVDLLERFKQGHALEGRAHYLRVRDEHFNPRRAEWRASGASVADYPVDLAAMVVYLNRTGYNGLFRVNASGQFNVPPGRYEKPRILDESLLAMASAALGAPNVELRHGVYDSVLEDAQAGDFVYLDPPYAPLSITANFRSYTGRPFGASDQRKLQQLAIALADRGVHVLLSNSVAPSVTALYEADAARAVGLRISHVPARRSVNSRPDRRGKIPELVVSNISPQ